MAEQEQPKAAPKRKTGESLIVRAANNWQLADAAAIQALARGEAEPEQQKRARALMGEIRRSLPELTAKLQVAVDQARKGTKGSVRPSGQK